MLSLLLASCTLVPPSPAAEAPFLDLTFEQALAEAGRARAALPEKERARFDRAVKRIRGER